MAIIKIEIDTAQDIDTDTQTILKALLDKDGATVPSKKAPTATPTATPAKPKAKAKTAKAKAKTAKAKAKTVPEQPAKPKDETPAPESWEPEPEAKKEVDTGALKILMSQKVVDFGKDTLKKILQSYGVERLYDLDPSKYPDLYKDLEAL